MEYISALCLYAVSTWVAAPPLHVAQETCEEVAVAAVAQGLSPSTVVALSFTESRFNPGARSSRGAAGPLQILPQFHCPGRSERGCDLIEAGVASVVRYQKKYGSDWLCHWNSGNKCFRRSRLFARIVSRRALELSRAVGEECRR